MRGARKLWSGIIGERKQRKGKRVMAFVKDCVTIFLMCLAGELFVLMGLVVGAVVVAGVVGFIALLLQAVGS